MKLRLERDCRSNSAVAPCDKGRRICLNASSCEGDLFKRTQKGTTAAESPAASFRRKDPTSDFLRQCFLSSGFQVRSIGSESPYTSTRNLR